MPWFSVPCTYTIVFAKHVCVFRTVISKLLTMNYHLKINFNFFISLILLLEQRKTFQECQFFLLVNQSTVYRFWSEVPASPVGCVPVVFG